MLHAHQGTLYVNSTPKICQYLLYNYTIVICYLQPGNIQHRMQSNMHRTQTSMFTTQLTLLFSIMYILLTDL